MALPVALPSTMPVAFMVAVAGALVVQVPLATESVRDMDEPTHTLLLPAIVPAVADVLTFTVMEVVAVPQLLVTAYDITEVPEVLPRTTPEPLTVATVGLPLVQLPPETVGVMVVKLPGQTMVLPDNDPAFGNGLTANTLVTVSAPQLPEIL